MEEYLVRLGWTEKLRAAAVALSTGLAFKLDPQKLIGSLVDLAIKVAKKQ